MFVRSQQTEGKIDLGKWQMAINPGNSGPLMKWLKEQHRKRWSKADPFLVTTNVEQR